MMSVFLREHYTKNKNISNRLFKQLYVFKLSTVDGGTKRRVRNVPFESKFVDDVDDAKWSNCENMYAIDRSLKQRIPSMGPALMRILLDHYPVYQCFRSSVHVPSKISVATDEFINNTMMT